MPEDAGSAEKAAPQSETDSGERIARIHGRSTVQSALINASALVLVGALGLVGGWLAHTSSSGDARASVSNAVGPLKISINEPKNGVIGYPTALTGRWTGLRPGQEIWTFHSMGSSKTFFPDNGPCHVNVQAHTWRCAPIFIGGPKHTTSTYRIWAVVISADTAFGLVEHFRCTTPPAKSCTLGISNSVAQEPTHLTNAIAWTYARRLK